MIFKRGSIASAQNAREELTVGRNKKGCDETTRERTLREKGERGEKAPGAILSHTRTYGEDVYWM